MFKNISKISFTYVMFNLDKLKKKNNMWRICFKFLTPQRSLNFRNLFYFRFFTPWIRIRILRIHIRNTDKNKQLTKNKN